MNAWLWSATVLTAALVPLTFVAARRPVIDGVVALEAAGTDAVLVLLLLSEGTHRQAFADLAIVLAVAGFVGAVAFLRFLQVLR